MCSRKKHVTTYDHCSLFVMEVEHMPSNCVLIVTGIVKWDFGEEEWFTLLGVSKVDTV